MKLKAEYEQKIMNIQRDMNKEFNHKIEVLSQTEKAKFTKLQEAGKSFLLE